MGAAAGDPCGGGIPMKQTGHLLFNAAALELFFRERLFRFGKQRRVEAKVSDKQIYIDGGALFNA